MNAKRGAAAPLPCACPQLRLQTSGVKAHAFVCSSPDFIPAPNLSLIPQSVVADYASRGGGPEEYAELSKALVDK
jgi:hypothetical protein